MILQHKNPVYEKELWYSDRSNVFSGALIGFHWIMAIIALAAFSSMLRYIEVHGQGNYAVMLQLYVVLVMVICIILICAIPGMAGAGISQERERNTLMLLSVSGVSPLAVVLGKYMAYMNTVLVLILAGMPATFLVFVYGGIQIKDILWMFAVLIMTAGYLSAAALFCSALVKKTGYAVVIAYAITVFLVGGTLLAHYTPLLLFGQAYGEEIGSAIAWYHYLLLFNPVLTVYGVLNQQAGSREFIFDMINYQGNYRSNWATENWTFLSLACQLTLTVLFLIITIRIIRSEKY